MFNQISVLSIITDIIIIIIIIASHTPWRWQTVYVNNNNSYIALYPVKIYKLAALYIINIKIRLTIKKKKKKEKDKYYKCIHQYQNDKKARMKPKNLNKNKTTTTVTYSQQQTNIVMLHKRPLYNCRRHTQRNHRSCLCFQASFLCNSILSRHPSQPPTRSTLMDPMRSSSIPRDEQQSRFSTATLTFFENEFWQDILQPKLFPSARGWAAVVVVVVVVVVGGGGSFLPSVVVVVVVA